MTCPKDSLNTKNLFKKIHPTQPKFVCPNKTTTILCKEILINIPIGNKRSKINLIMKERIPGPALTNILMHCLLMHSRHVPI